MEFIITTLNTSGFDFLESCIYRRGKPTTIGLSPVSIWCSDRPECHNEYQILFDGYLFNEGSFYHRLLNANVGILNPETCDGVFCYAMVGDDIRLYADPLGQYHLYYYLHSDGFAVSNNIHLIADLCKYLHQPVSKSIHPSLHNIINGSSLGSTTQYQKIYCLKVGESINICAGQLEIIKPKICNQMLSYDDALHIASERLVSNFTAFLEAVDGDINLDITAGKDSRLVFALAKKCNALDKIRVRNIIKYSGHPDYNVATWFVEKYNLLGGKSLMTKPEGNALINSIAYSAFLFGGCRGNGGSYLSRKTFPNYTHLSGKFGEIAGKSTSRPVDLTDIPKQRMAHHLSNVIIWRRRDLVKVGKCLSDEGIDIVRKALVSEVQYLLDLGVPHDHLVSEHYLQSRCRDHFGMLSVHENRYKIAPDFLALKALVDCRRALSVEQHAANKVIFDLTYLLGGEEVLFAPTDKPWGKNIVPDYLLSGYQNQPIVKLDSPLIGKPIELLNAEYVKTDFKVSKPSLVIETEKQSISKRFASEKHIRGLQQITKYYSAKNQYDVFDYDVISQLCVKSPKEFSPMQSGLLGNLATALVWMSNDEMKVYLDT